MEIHAPHKPVLTLKEAVVHLVIVTIGILIALSFEGILEWSHHRAQVREAKTTLAAEIQDNRNEIERLLGEIPGMTEKFRHAIDVINALSGGRNNQAVQEANELFKTSNGSPGPKALVYGYDLARLAEDDRTTAEVTGAFAFMDHADVKRYATAYDRQKLFNQAQDLAFEKSVSAFGLGQGLEFDKATPSELENLKQQLRFAIGELMVEREIGGVLKERYDSALAIKATH